MFIHLEETPNPLSIKFVPECIVLQQGVEEYTDPIQDAAPPMIHALFETGSIDRVFLGEDFITITKKEHEDWGSLKPHVLGILTYHLQHTHQSHVLHNETKTDQETHEKDPLVREILDVLDMHVRPAVADDGGYVAFKGFEDGTVYLEMQGACAACPRSQETLKDGIERVLQYYVPEVKNVQAR